VAHFFATTVHRRCDFASRQFETCGGLRSISRVELIADGGVCSALVAFLTRARSMVGAGKAKVRGCGEALALKIRASELVDAAAGGEAGESSASIERTGRGWVRRSLVQTRGWKPREVHEKSDCGCVY
jgi:hypothetical protein